MAASLYVVMIWWCDSAPSNMKIQEECRLLKIYVAEDFLTVMRVMGGCCELGFYGLGGCWLGYVRDAVLARCLMHGER